MVAVPATVALAVATPVEPTTLAAELLILHVPPVLASLNVVVAPSHINRLPLIAANELLTVMIMEPVQPLAVV